VSEQCSKHMRQAHARGNALRVCTDGRTDLRRTTHLSNYLAFRNARAGGAAKLIHSAVRNA
jgi:hypothetical protein